MASDRFSNLLNRLDSLSDEAFEEELEDSERVNEIVKSLQPELPTARPAAARLSTAEVAESHAGRPAGIQFDDGVFRPRTADDVRTLIDYGRTTGRKVRVAGASHSAEGAIYSDSKRDVALLLDGNLRGIEATEGSDGTLRISVGGGCYLGRNPSDSTSTFGDSLIAFLEARGLALPVLGGISHQSVGGFLQTGTTGGSLTHNITDVLAEIELVDGTGELITLNAGTDEFNAAGVAMGLHGVVTRVTLTPPPRYLVEGKEENYKRRDSFLSRSSDGTYPLRNALETHEYIHLNWFPQRYVGRVMQWTGAQIEYGAPGVPYHNVLRHRLLSVLAAFVLAVAGGLIRLDPRSKLFQRVVGLLLTQFLPLGKALGFRDHWYRALPSDDEVLVDTVMKTLFTEIWLPVEDTDRVLRVLDGLLEDQAVAGNFAVELYGAKRSPFWLSPAYGRDVLRVDPYFWAYSLGEPEEYFKPYWDALLGLPGARLHWGKYMPKPGQQCGDLTFGPDFFQRTYPRFGAWLDIRRERDPDAVFITPYWKGLLGVED